MSVTQIASLFPASDRKKILEENWISQAVPNSTNTHMRMLMIYWKEYVEPSLNESCNLCYDRVLRNWKGLQPALIELERQSRLLNDA